MSSNLKGLGLDFGFTLVEHRISPEECVKISLQNIDIDIELFSIIQARPFLQAPNPQITQDEDQWRRDLIDFYYKWLIKLDLDSNLDSNSIGNIAHAILSMYEAPLNWQSLLGTEEFLQTCKTLGVKVGILSNWSTNLRTVITTLGWDKYLNAIICSSEIGVVKPHPAAFTELAGKMYLEPQEILFVGDSVEADYFGATASGMKAILFANKTPKIPLPDGVDYIGHIQEALSYF